MSRSTPHAFPAAVALAVGSLLAARAGAESLRFHAGADAGRALAGHQAREFGWGAGAYGALEYPFDRRAGVALELGGLWLSEGKPPRDPRLAPLGDSSALWGALGLELRPFATSYAGRAASPAGIWMSGAVGLTATGGQGRPMLDARVGWDLLPGGGKFGIGPEVGYLYTLQPDSKVRPDDAHVLLLGLHVMFDTSTERALVDGDRDGDGIRDSVDRCPDDPEDKDGFEDEDGCPDLDNDKDGIPDKTDKCPNDPEDKDKFQDEDGCPDRDNDGDGILDAEDLCPNEPETWNGYADTDGCPDEEQVRVVGDKIVLDDRVHFATNNARIRVLSYPLLTRLAKLIREHPEYVHIHVEGHADARGDEKFNLWLSEERAKSVVRFLVERGVEERRLSSEGFGAKRPVVDSKTEGAWYLNRRVEFKVTREKRASAGETPPSAPPPASSAAPAEPPPPPPPPGQGEVEEPGEKEEHP
jgi:outer membrane protein OmpA-like peptidoglycan-associated protein